MSQPVSAQHGRLPWHHLWVVRFGPLGLCALGLALLIVSMTVRRNDAVEVAYITLGTVLVIAGTLVPRFKGAVEVTTTGVKGQLSTIQDLDRYAYALVGAGASPRPWKSIQIGRPAEPVRASDVSIQAILNAAEQQGWSAESDSNTGHFVLSSQDAPEKLLLPGNPSWMATHDLLRVLDASGLQVSAQTDEGRRLAE